MPEFQYQGVDKAGKKVSGKLEANGEGDVRMLLRSQGVRPTRISKGGALNTDIGMLLSGGVHTLKLEQLVTFTRQLQVLISSGVPIVQGLEILGEQAPDKSLKMIILSLREKVSGGMFFWEAIASFPKAFPKIFVALVRAGEASGSLDQMLKRLSR
ncbi:MAG: type II secretion system F family protein, partial [Bdellovibrionota bacterium]